MISKSRGKVAEKDRFFNCSTKEKHQRWEKRFAPVHMNHIHVTCAIIEYNGLVLAARRSADMKLPLKWEFPGGKIRAGEDPGDCLRREIREELDIEVEIAGDLIPSTHHYPDFIVTLYPFICKAETSRFKLAEHAEAVWLQPDKLYRLDWAEADLPVLDAYLAALERRG